MKISLGVFLKDFPVRYEAAYIKSSESPDYSCAGLFSNELLIKESEFIYICDSDELKNVNFLPHNITLFVVGWPEYIEDYKEQDVNLIILPGEYSVGKLLSEMQKVFLRYNNWYEAIGRAALQKWSLQKMVNLSEKIIGYPLAVIDSAFNVLAASRFSNPNDDAWMEFQGKSLRVNTMSKDSVNASDIRAGKGPVQIYSTLSERYVMSQAIWINGKCVGYASAHRPDPGKARFTAGEEQLLAVFTEMVAKRMQSEEFYVNVSDDDFSHLFLNIISERITERNTILQRAAYINTVLKGYMMVLKINPILPKTADFEKMRSRICHIYVNATCIVRNSTLYVLISQLEPEYVFDEDKLISALEGTPADTGISMLFNDPGYIYDHYLQSEKAVELGKVMEPSKNLYYYEDYIVYDGCKMLMESIPDPEAFIHRYITALSEDDTDRTSHLVESLNAYLINDRNINKTAQKMFVHRNTMVYRINRIMDILRDDFKDNRKCLNLLFSYAFYEYILKTKENL